MTEEPRRKKRSEKLSDSFAARLGREIGAGDRPGATSGESRGREERVRDSAQLASMQSQQRHSFTRCPHCREFVPIRDSCRSCGGPIS